MVQNNNVHFILTKTYRSMFTVDEKEINIENYFRGEFPPIPRIPNSPKKNTQNTQKNEKCIKFTPRYVVPPEHSLEFTQIYNSTNDARRANE